jgi:F-type H+-transporting ATPase subunit epsilon
VADTFHCKLITPQAQALDRDVTYASVPAWDGLFGVAPGRAPLLYKLGLGTLRLDFPEGGSRWYLVEDGVAHLVNNELTLLCEAATPVEQIDATDAKAEYAEADAYHPHDLASADKKARDLDRARLKMSLVAAHGDRGGGI